MPGTALHCAGSPLAPCLTCQAHQQSRICPDSACRCVPAAGSARGSPPAGSSGPCSGNSAPRGRRRGGWRVPPRARHGGGPLLVIPPASSVPPVVGRHCLAVWQGQRQEEAPRLPAIRGFLPPSGDAGGVRKPASARKSLPASGHAETDSALVPCAPGGRAGCSSPR